MKLVLVIGYGNTLRGDDGAGVRAAELIAECHPEIACITTHQLTPELAERIAESDIVFFVDAQAEAQEVTARLISPQVVAEQPRTHFLSPEKLLTLCQQLYNRVPAHSYCICIPAVSFDFSEQLSPSTASAIEESLAVVDKCLML